ncbi:MAG: hypothetical protein AAF415_13580 [Pseudomonadota bacterium]
MLAAIGRAALPSRAEPVSIGVNAVPLEIAGVALDALERGDLLGAIHVCAAAAMFSGGKIDIGYGRAEASKLDKGRWLKEGWLSTAPPAGRRAEKLIKDDAVPDQVRDSQA